MGAWPGRIGMLVAIVTLLLAIVALAAHFVTPWPSVLVIRTIFDRGAAAASAKLASHVPADVKVEKGIQYDPASPLSRLDIYRPPAGVHTGPTIVWVHGGGFISGRRNDVENYGRILAGKSFTVINVDYSIAPEAIYPMPVRQVNAALGFVSREAVRLGIDPSRLIVAGDSAGAQIAAQVANLVTAPDYARKIGIAPAIHAMQLRGTILFCGPFDLDLMSDGWFMRTTTWAYSGRRNHREDASFQLMSVAKHVTRSFPPSFISAGNGDPLLAHSFALEKALRSQDVPVDTLYFENHTPPLAHEYQFDLDTDAGREALRRAVAFARKVQ